MPMNIDLTFSELPSSSSANILGAMLRLGVIEKEAKDYNDSNEGEAILTACAALRSCTLFAQETESNARGMLGNVGDAIRMFADMATSSVPTTGYTVPGEYQNAVDAARKEVTQRFTADAWKRTLAARQASAESHAKNAKNAMSAATRAVDTARARFTAPLALRSQTTADDLCALAAIRTESEGQCPSMWLDIFKALVTAGDTQAENVYAIAVRSLAQAAVMMSEAKIREVYGAAAFAAAGMRSLTGPHSTERREVMEREQTAAEDFLRLAATRATEQTPASLAFSQAALVQLRGVFLALLGGDVMNDNVNELHVDPSWPMRLGLAKPTK